MPGVLTNKKDLHIGKCLDDLHKLSEVKPLPHGANAMVRSAEKVFRDAERVDNEGDEEKAMVMYMKYFNILKQVKTKAEYKKQKEYYDKLIGRRNQLQAIERAEKLTESLKERYDFKEAELLAKKLPPVDSAPAKKVAPKEKDAPKDTHNASIKVESNDKEPKKQCSVTCMQLCELLRDSGTKLILMDTRSPADFAKSHVSHSECISVPADIIVPGSTVTHIETKLTDESKVVWKTRKNADHIILIDWKSKTEDVKIGTPIQTLRDALYKFDMNVIIKSEPLLLEGGYQNWLVFYPTMTTNPHVSVPDKDAGTNNRTPSPSLLLDFDYPELDENLQKKVKAPPPVLNNNITPAADNTNNIAASMMNPPVPRVDRSLKPSVANQPGSLNSNKPQLNNNSPDPLVNNNMYPSIYPPPGVNGPKQINTMKADDLVTAGKVAQKQINLSIKNDLSGEGHKGGAKDQISRMKNQKVQEENERTEEVERKLRELEVLKKKKERDVADLMRKERKIKEELESERLNREENQRVEEEKRKIARDQAEKEDEDRKKRVMDVEKLRMERKKQEGEKEEEELQKIKAEQEARAVREEMERKEKELKQLEEQKRLDQEEEEKIAKEMQELEKAKLERSKTEELRRIEEQRLDAEREKERQEVAQKEEVERKRKEMIKLEEEKKAKEIAEQKRLLEIKNKENSAKDQRNEKVVPTTNLPTGWEKRLDRDTNRYYYIDHNRGITTWQAPTGVTISNGPTRDTYTAKLKDEPTLSRSLSRSHSSPNIMKELAEEEEALARKPLVAVDRTSKPSQKTSNKVVQPMYSMRKRDLNPTYGNVIQGLTGLRNLGNTCYMNSTIQCLNNTSPLITYFLSDNYHRDVNRESSQGMHGEVVDDFSVVIKALWSGQYRSITPRDLKSVVGKYNPMFSGYQQQDSQEFLTFLLDGLHEGLNEVKKAPEIPEQNNDKLSDDKAARLAWDHHKLLHKSIIVELFQGQLKSTLMCRTCMKTSVTFQAFMFLSLPIPASSRCTLKDCIQEFLKPEMMTGSCKWKCPRCKIERDSEKKIDIWKLPPILLVGLNRFYSEGMWMQKKTTYVDFPLMDVDFSPYTLGPAPPKNYNLYGISNHYGTMEGGHYTAFCRNPVTTKWYKFDDQDVSDISKSDVKTSAAFVLYYTSIEMPAPQYKIGF